jgi:hypothetical protein
MNLNLSERRGTARLMSAWERYAEVQRFERDEGLRNDRRRWRKGDDVRDRSGAGSTAERAVLEMAVRSRVVVLVMRRNLRLVGRRTRFQQKRRTARRHEADGYISTKQEDYQQQAGE